MEIEGDPLGNLIISRDSPTTDPKTSSVLFVGRVENLLKLDFSLVKHKLEPRVSKEIWEAALESLGPCHNSSEIVPLYLKQAAIAGLPCRASRHNAPSRPSSLLPLVKSGAYQTVVLVCPRADAYPLTSALAQALPLVSYKSSGDGGGGGGGGPTREEPSLRAEYILTDLPSPLGFLSDLEDLTVLSALAAGVRSTAAIVDKPTNFMGVTHFLEELEALSKAYNLQYKVIRGQDLAKLGYGGLYGVGKASVDPPALAVLSYLPQGTPSTTFAWVGKGIVYDTGGLSIKSKTGMPGMKRDCGGAAAVLGGLLAVARTGSSAAVHGVFCLAENSVGANGTRPDDVHTLLSGRTVEVNNTDAEGRLVLADGVVHAARHLAPDVIVDIATLTAAQGMTTGKHHGAILTNSEEWEVEAVRLSKASGDLLYPIVFAPELHFSEYSSAIADMKNSVNDRWNAQSSCAGLFILSHLGFDTSTPWLHIDMAYPVHSGERATGYGVALLLLLQGKYSHKKLLRDIAAQ